MSKSRLSTEKSGSESISNMGSGGPRQDFQSHVYIWNVHEGGFKDRRSNNYLTSVIAIFYDLSSTILAMRG